VGADLPRVALYLLETSSTGFRGPGSRVADSWAPAPLIPGASLCSAREAVLSGGRRRRDGSVLTRGNMLSED
jgi:hypothetical protein